MKAFRRIVLLIDLVATVTAALLIFVGISDFPSRAGVWVRDLALATQTDHRLFVTVLTSCLVILAINLFFIFYAIRYTLLLSDRGLRIDRPDGRVFVKASAIEAVLVQALKGLPQVDLAKVYVIGGKREKSRTFITIQVRLVEAVDVPSTVRELQSTVKTRFAELFGTQRLVFVNVIVHRFGKKSGGEPEIPPGDIIRPRYTVEEE